MTSKSTVNAAVSLSSPIMTTNVGPVLTCTLLGRQFSFGQELIYDRFLWERKGKKIISFLTVIFTVRKTFKCCLKSGTLFKLLPPVNLDKVRYSF